MTTFKDNQDEIKALFQKVEDKQAVIETKLLELETKLNIVVDNTGVKP